MRALFDAAPFGMEILAGGARIYANSASAYCNNSEHFRTRSFAYPQGTSEIEARISFDDTNQIEAEQALVQKAYFDALTGLPKGDVVESSVNALINEGDTPFALVVVDLDGLKNVNDYFGHAVGDALLMKFAQRLGANLRESDLLARLSGDVFLVLLSPIESLENLSAKVDELSERIKEPFFVNGHEVFTSGSMGVSIFPEHGRSYDALRSNADRAMYRGRAVTKGRFQFYDESLARDSVEKSRLEQRLRLAIRDGRVRCAYQPKVDLRTGEVVGVEALMRWIDENGAIHGPGGFLGLAAELGLTDELTRIVLAETVRSVDLIGDAFGRDCSLSINVAAKQAGNISFMRFLTDEMEASGFAHRFMIEVTEEAFLAKSDFQIDILPMIRAIGARVSIDDFGTGYSSLSALADITADEIKIDRSFITDVHKRPRSQSVLKAIEALGNSLGMSIIVEGVETYEELAYLQAATRIQLAQGYYFSQPMMLEDFGSEPMRQRSNLRSLATRIASTGRG